MYQVINTCTGNVVYTTKDINAAERKMSQIAYNTGNGDLTIERGEATKLEHLNLKQLNSYLVDTIGCDSFGSEACARHYIRNSGQEIECLRYING